MNKLQEITIKVPEEIAQAYRESSDLEKQQIELKFSTLMKLKINAIQTDKVDTLGQLMDDISRKAIARGLTPEILEEILNEDE
ncbi:hypothetical protein [Planktothrix paucivesiculata]|uniref:Uncharacterized protein n=1 Tax=Planktothrix paucivesiculata PCC 9631 TaxID=671071 RepID=A0A7Z9BGZ6_9CYAN|nr:hypothetical protein [Planktothrix paucivesiculata]VXD13253.1 conserved hypothetical protein [Planktothrix paucivesiculata PCC 9631]